MEQNEQSYFKISHLIRRAIKNELSPAEKAELDQWLLQDEANQKLFDELTDEAIRSGELQHIGKYDEGKGFAKFLSKLSQKDIIPMPARRRWLYPAAASIILALSFGSYFILHKKQAVQQTAQNQQHDLKPGENKATLTLANGQKIVLTKNMSGQLARQGNMNIQMAAGGTVTYKVGTDNHIAENVLAYNTLTTKKGEQFPLVLADGTEVTLDAASSITYPVVFNGTERKVTITGQAYFKVVHNEKQPFLVSVKGQTIRDIGTEFNINAYDDEPEIRTTLLLGSVSISNNAQKVILKPGQQAVTHTDQNAIVVQNANTEAVIAWKNGIFEFNNVHIPDIMRQVGRWYDVDISYQGKIPEMTFNGEMSRNVNASKLLEMLSYAGIHFRIEGKKIIVTQ